MRRFLIGCVILVGPGALAACSTGGHFAEREPWRKEAESRCIASGTLHEGAGVVRISPINGPGMCGADFPFKVTSLGEPGVLGFGDEYRPPASIPGSAALPPRWPITEPSDAEPRYTPRPAPRSSVESRPLPPPTRDQPVSLEPPNAPPAGGLEIYDYRRPYGAAPSAEPRPVSPAARAVARGRPLDPNSPAYDLSPEPYVNRAPVDGGSGARGYDLPPAPARAGREPRQVPLGPSRAPRIAATGTITVTPAATLACPLVTVLDQWIASAVQPAAMRWFGEPVAEIRQISAYSCRGMNGNPRAKISEHAFGNALDIASFTLADGRRITVKDGWRGTPEQQGFLRDVQAAACDRFTTVLAPGSNAFHYDHMHVDLMHRRNGYRACNPRAVSGEEVAARARAHYARQGGDPGVTGSVARKGTSRKRLPPTAFAEDKVGHQLPSAIPGEDGED